MWLALGWFTAGCLFCTKTLWSNNSEWARPAKTHTHQHTITSLLKHWNSPGGDTQTPEHRWTHTWTDSPEWYEQQLPAPCSSLCVLSRWVCTWHIGERLSQHWQLEIQLFFLQFDQSVEEQLRVLVMFPLNTDGRRFCLDHEFNLNAIFCCLYIYIFLWHSQWPISFYPPQKIQFVPRPIVVLRRIRILLLLKHFQSEQSCRISITFISLMWEMHNSAPGRII